MLGEKISKNNILVLWRGVGVCLRGEHLLWEGG